MNTTVQCSLYSTYNAITNYTGISDTRPAQSPNEQLKYTLLSQQTAENEGQSRLCPTDVLTQIWTSPNPTHTKFEKKDRPNLSRPNRWRDRPTANSDV